MPAAPALLVAVLLGGAVACGGGSGAGALPSLTATPTRSLPSQPQPSNSAALTPPPTTAPPATVTATATATTTARPPRTSTPTAATSSQAVVAPSAVASTTAAATPATSQAPVSSSSDSGSTWGWWVLAIVVVAAIAGGTVWVVLRRRQKWAQWRAAAGPVARQTHVVIDLVPIPPQRPADPAHWQLVREEVEHNAEDLETVAANAPSDEATRVTRGVATALRDEVTAVEALRLLQAAPTAPTGAELSQAEEVTRHARGDLDASQARLDGLIGAEIGADASPPAPIN